MLYLQIDNGKVVSWSNKRINKEDIELRNNDGAKLAFWFAGEHGYAMYKLKKESK